MKLSLGLYDEGFLECSWKWLNDPEIKTLTMTPDFSKVDQIKFFKSISSREDYKIWGLLLNGVRKVGACGLKNICENSAEYWGYIGEKDIWGKGIGCQMMSLVNAQAHDMGLQSLYLKVSRGNLRAIALYTKYGYQIESEDDLVRFMRLPIRNDY